MKHILSIAVAAIVVAAGAADFSPQIGVTTRALSGKNNIIPVQFESLTNGNVTVDALVCTNNIPLTSQLLVYINGSYSAWTLAAGGWTPYGTASTVDGVSVSGGAANTTLATGSAIWLSFSSEQSNVPVSFYGKVASVTNSVITARKVNLIANPTEGEVNIIAKLNEKPVVAGDVIRVVGSVDQIKRNKTNNGWIKYDPDNGVVNVDTLSVPGYTGVWYYSNTNAVEDITINWN